MFAWIRENRVEFFLLAILFVVTIGLRFPHLGYSDYIGDEHKSFFQPEEGQSGWEFFMEQRKGPMQFVVSYIPYLFTQDWNNELAERLPFTILGTLAVFVFYALIKKLIQNKTAAFLAALLLAVNGFIIGFARIAQYQNLNLLFSFSALFFYADFLRPGAKILRNSLFGTFFLCLSVLSHWDAIFVLTPTLVLFGIFLLNRQILVKNKLGVFFANLALGCLILLPFLLPYINYQSGHNNLEYFERRVSIEEKGSLPSDGYEFLIRLYNPFYVLEFLTVAGVLALLFIRRTWMYALWFGVNFGLFWFFVKKPGTHVYNFVIPAIVLAALGTAFLVEKLSGIWRKAALAVVAAFLAFFVYQSYVIFVDHAVEYPWKQEGLLGGRLVTPEYSVKDKPPLFGFPLSRDWKEINEFINYQNKMRGEDFGYQSNEVKTITEWYVDVGYEAQSFYGIGIKRPLSFVEDWKFPQYGGKEVVHEIKNNGETVVRIYRIE